MKYTIKSQTRTIYVVVNQNPSMNTSDSCLKFRLTFPELIIKNNKVVYFIHNDVEIPFPFFNIDLSGEICFGYNNLKIIKATNKEEFEEYFWNKKFSPTNLGGFINLFGKFDDCKRITGKSPIIIDVHRKSKEYCKYWEKHGFLEAYKTFKGKFYQ